MLTQLGPEKLCHGQGTWMGPEGLSSKPQAQKPHLMLETQLFKHFWWQRAHTFKAICAL